MTQDNNKNKIEVTVQHAGKEIDLIANVHHKIKHVQEKALEKFKVEHGFDPPSNSVIFLRYDTTDLSEPEKSLEDYNIPDKAVLDLIVQAGVG